MRRMRRRKGYNSDEEEGVAANTSAFDLVVATLVLGHETASWVVSDLPSCSTFHAQEDVPAALSELLALSPSLDDGEMAPINAKDPIQPAQEAFELYSEGLQTLLQTPERL